MQLLFAFVVCLGLIGSTTLAAPICDFNGCSYSTAEVGVTTITFNSSGYFPACIQVAADTDVTFEGVFTTYPLSGGYLDDLDVEQLFDSEITNVTTGTTVTFTMVTAGSVPFYSPNNAINGFKGAIFVGTTCDTPPVGPVAPSAPTAVPNAPTAAPSAPTAGPSAPTAAPSAPTAAPTAAPSNEPVAEPQVSTPSSEPLSEPSAPSAAPVDSPIRVTSRPPRTRVSSGAQVIASVGLLAMVGVAMV